MTGSRPETEQNEVVAPTEKAPNTENPDQELVQESEQKPEAQVGEEAVVIEKNVEGNRVASDCPANVDKSTSANAQTDIEMKKTQLKNGWVSENGKTHYYDKGKIQTGWAVSDSYQNYGLQRYWLGAYGDLVTSRIVNTNMNGSLTYCTSRGYVARFKYKETDGKLYLASNEGKLENTGWLVTGYYDGGSLHRFYIDETTHSARLGFFTISGRKYYGYSDLAYVLHADYDYLEGHWYTANNDGVLSNADSRFALIERYVSWMIAIANDNSHGYDQRYRWGERGDYDCSSLTISALRVAGVDTRWATYTGNMRSALTGSGFYCRGFDNLKRGDILLNDTYHVAVYIGNGMIVQASGNEWGGAVGGQPGDQTGREIWVCGYYSYPWNTVLRFNC